MENTNKRPHKYRIYISYVSRIGQELGRYYEDEFDKANEHFERLMNMGREAVDLQELDPQTGIVTNTIRTTTTENFKQRKKAYYDRLAEEETWRPGDARWNAPGMSIHDFI